MKPITLMKFVFVALMLFMTIAINLPDGMIARLGFEPNYLLAALAANIMAGFLVYRRLAVITLVCLLSLGANMPETFVPFIDFDRDYMTAALGLTVFSPSLYRQFE